MTKTQTIQKFDTARNRWADLTTSAKTALMTTGVFGLAALSQAGAADGDWDISGAQATVTTLIGVGVAITIALVVFKLGKKAANKVG